MLRLTVFTALLVLWCTVHSLLATNRCKRRLRGFFGPNGRWYRLAYNILALATLLPLLIWGWSLPGETVLAWSGPWRPLRSVLWIIAAVFFLGGCRAYNLSEFAGLVGQNKRQGKDGGGEDRGLATGGILGTVRHPWYTAALIVLWARNLDTPALAVSAVFTLYLLLGALLEERRLTEEFGDAYRLYRRQVPMFVPWKWPGQALARRRRR